MEAEDDNADVNVEEDEEDNSEGVDAFSDGGDSAEETDAFDAGEGTPAADAVVHMTVSVAGEFAKDKNGALMVDRDVTKHSLQHMMSTIMTVQLQVMQPQMESMANTFPNSGEMKVVHLVTG